jgi:uracil-DNA glycosylase
MLNYYIILITAIVCYIITVDKNVITWLVLNWKLFVINLQRVKFMLIYHPKNPITNWRSEMRYRKIAKELQEEIKRNATSETDRPG